MNSSSLHVLKERQLELVGFIQFKSCDSFCFVDDKTLIATGFDSNCVKRYTRANSSSSKWTQDAKLEIRYPSEIKSISGNVYFTSQRLGMELHWLSSDFKNQQVLYDVKEYKEGRIVVFSGLLCVYFKGEKDIKRFKGKEL